jgi:hypothetical protein
LLGVTSGIAVKAIRDDPDNARMNFGGTMNKDIMRGRVVPLGLFIGLVLALGGCGQLASQQPPVQSPMSQQVPLKLPPL